MDREAWCAAVHEPRSANYNTYLAKSKSLKVMLEVGEISEKNKGKLLSCFSRVQLYATHRRQPTRLPVPGILQARTLEWVAISFSNA